MWRIYSKEDKAAGVDNTSLFYGVRIETTARKLLNVIYVDDSAMAHTWIGKVLYKNEDEINASLSDGIVNINLALGDSFFNKRKEFDHESEFRAILLLDSNTIEHTSNYKRIAFPIECIDDFFDSFVLDPRLKEPNYQILKERLLTLGVNPQKISKSSLYHFEPITVKMR